MQTLEEPAFIGTGLEYLFRSIYNFFLKFFSINWLGFMYIVASIATIGVIFIILYSLVRLYEMKKEDKEKERKAKKANPLSSTSENPTSDSSLDFLSENTNQKTIPPNPVWESIRERVLSDNPTDWRLAIIEADIYLDRQLDAKGWHGDTIGDKLKQLTPVELPSIQIAWEAHKVRNRIAHDLDYVLTAPEARRVLSYFEIVFKDLGLVE